jgi:hypothetical protein
MNKIITGIDNTKCKASLNTIEYTKLSLGKLTFFINVALFKNKVDDAKSELTNHCQQNNPEIKNKA